MSLSGGSPGRDRIGGLVSDTAEKTRPAPQDGLGKSNAQPAAPSENSSSSALSLWIGAIVIFAAVAALVALPMWSATLGQPKAMPCSFPGEPSQAPGSPGPSTQPLKLVLINGQATTLAFDRALTTKTLTIQYGVTGTIQGVGQYPQLQVSQQDFLRSDQVALPSDRVKVAAWYQNGRVLLKVCVDRSGSKLADPGSYQGTVSIVDPRVDRVDIPIVVTLSYPSWQLVLELLIIAALAGSWYVWVLQKKGLSDPAISRGFVEYCGSMLGMLSIAAGVIAAIGVYNATYLNSTSWGSTAEQPLSLLGAMFGAFLAGAASVHIGAKAGLADADKSQAKNPARANDQAQATDPPRAPDPAQAKDPAQGQGSGAQATDPAVSTGEA